LPADMGAWEWVQRGVFGSFEPCLESSRKSIDCLRTAVEIDPDYAYARAALAWMIFSSVINGWTEDIEGSFREGEEHLRVASSLSSDDALVLFYIGSAYAYTGRMEQAIRTLQKSLDRNPNQPDVLVHIGIARGHLADYAEAYACFDRAEELSPTGGMSFAYGWYRAIVLFIEERYEEAIELLEHYVIERVPRYATPRVILGLALAATGRIQEAKDTIEAAARFDPGLCVDGIALNIGAHPIPELGLQRVAWLREFWPDE